MVLERLTLLRTGYPVALLLLALLVAPEPASATAAMLKEEGKRVSKLQERKRT
jgi:hypothetical protein